MVCRVSRRGSLSRGTLLRSPTVYGWCGLRKSSFAGPLSTMRPAYMTRIRRHMPATTPRSWVMTITAASCSRAELLEQPQDLRLDGHVQRGGGLVGQQQLGVAAQRDGDHDALAHAAAELVRVVLDAARGLGDADLAEQLDGALDRVGVAQAQVQLEALGHEALDGQHRVQAGDGVLEDHRDVAAADGAHLVLGQREQVPALELDAAAHAGVGHHAGEADDGAGGDALAAAALADEPDELAGRDLEAHVVHRVHASPPGTRSPR